MTKSLPDFERFALERPLDEAAIEKQVAARTKVYAPTGQSSETAEQHIGVFVTMPPKLHGTEVLVRGTAWSDENEREDGARLDGILAYLTGRPVASANSPGVEYKPWRGEENNGSHALTEQQVEELNRGFFKKTGAGVMHALHHTIMNLGIPEISENPRIVWSGSSMAAAMGAAAAHHAMEAGITLSGIAFVDTVNLEPLKRPALVRLASRFHAADATSEGYLEKNPQFLREVTERKKAWGRRVLSSFGTNWKYVNALKRGKFYDDLGDMSRLADNNVPVSVAHGGASHLSFPHLNDQLVTSLLDKGVTIADWAEYPGQDHGFTMTVKGVIDPLRNIISMPEN